MKIIRKTVGPLMMLLIWPLTPTAQTKPVDEVRQAEMRWISAIKAKDKAALASILSNDLVYTHSSGVVESKEQYIAALSSGTQKYESVDYEDPFIKIYGNTAVLATKARMVGSTKGQPFNNLLRLLHVWVKQRGGWELVAHQTTRLP